MLSAPEPASAPLTGDAAPAAGTSYQAPDMADTEEKQVSQSSGDGQTSDESSNEAPEEFKEGGYGWVVALAVFLLNAHTWGMNSSYSVFLAYYLSHDVFPGASAIAFAFVGGLSISIALLVSPLATVSVGRLGTRVSLLIGVFFETIAFIGASFTSRIWHLLLSQGVAFGIGMGFIFVATVGILPQWFTKRRSFANAIGTAGTGIGGLTYALATNAMIRNIGLAWAFRVIALIVFVVNTVATLLVRDRNKSVGSVHVPFRLSLLRRVEYVFLTCWAFFSVLAYTIVIFSLPDYAEAVGRSASQGSLVAALFNLSQGLGRPVLGFVSDRVGCLNIMGLGTLAAGASALFIWIFAGKYYAGLIVYSLLGAFAGLVWATVAPVTAAIVGIPLLPSALSVLWILLVAPATCAEAIGLSLRTSAGVNSYLHVQLFTGFCFVGAFIFAWLLRAWKLHELEDDANQESGTPRITFSSYLLKGKWVFSTQRV